MRSRFRFQQALSTDATAAEPTATKTRMASK
jgi:hypothetical protein